MPISGGAILCASTSCEAASPAEAAQLPGEAMAYATISIPELFERISERLDASANGRPPLTLILGSGFSFPIIPTTAQVVRDDLPWWKCCQSGKVQGPVAADFFDAGRTTAFTGLSRDYAKGFWKRVKDAADGRAAKDARFTSFSLDAEGLPRREDVSSAYKTVLSPWCAPGLSSPEQVRRYFGDIVKRVGARLNPAHLYLAALLAERRGLCGTIFTTNFDPLLQRALQMVNLPYFVSDRPDTMQHPDDDTVADALHLVYAHGSIYRYLLLNTPEQIEAYAEHNHSLLQEYFRKHAVLIVGYSGWDDAITRALGKVEQFAHNLYWCDRGASVEESGLSPEGRAILARHSNAFYVPIKGADDLLVGLHQHLISHALPRLFRVPIEVVKEQLRQCDLTGVKVASRSGPAHADEAAAGAGGAGVAPSGQELDLGVESTTILKRLEDAERQFNGGVSASAVTDERALLIARVRQQMAEATDLYFGPHDSLAMPHLDFVLAHADVLEPAEIALASSRRGYLHAAAGDLDDAIADYSVVIEMPVVPVEERVKARINRGIAYRRRGQVGDVEHAIGDLTAAAEMSGASAEMRARALISRAVSYSQRGQAGDAEHAVADYTAVVDMRDAPPDQRARALLNRAIAYGERDQPGDADREIADYTAVIDRPEAPAEQRAMARVNRAAAFGKRGQAGDLDSAIADYTAVIDMGDATAQQRATARVNRGVAYGRRGQPGDADRETEDYTAAIELPDTPAEERTRARFYRAITYAQRGQEGDVDRAIADHGAVIEAADAPAQMRAKACVNRGIAYRERGGAGDVARAIADFTAAMEMADAPAELREEARRLKDLAGQGPGQRPPGV